MCVCVCPACLELLWLYIRHVSFLLFTCTVFSCYPVWQELLTLKTSHDQWIDDAFVLVEVSVHRFSRSMPSKDAATNTIPVDELPKKVVVLPTPVLSSSLSAVRVQDNPRLVSIDRSQWCEMVLLWCSEIPSTSEYELHPLGYL